MGWAKRRSCEQCGPHCAQTKYPRTLSLAHLGRVGCSSNSRGNLVAKFEDFGRNHVFSCSPAVPSEGHHCSPERAHDRRGRVSGIRAEECALDLRAGKSRCKKPDWYGGCHLSILVG